MGINTLRWKLKRLLAKIPSKCYGGFPVRLESKKAFKRELRRANPIMNRITWHMPEPGGK